MLPIVMEDNAMAKPLLTDELWEFIEPLLPKQPPRPKGGRPSVDNRKVLTGILFVLKTGIPWEYLPPEMGCGSGMTCWRRLQTWKEKGVWDKIHQVLLNQLRQADQIDFSRAIVDSASVRAVFGGRKRARIRRIDGNWGRNITCSPTLKVSPSSYN
jgi:transposase